MPTISDLCCFVCSEFGSSGRSFQLENETIANILNLKEEDLTPNILSQISAEMFSHGYLCVITESAIFIHFSLINSIGFIDESFLESFAESFEEETEEPSEQNNLKHLH